LSEADCLLIWPLSTTGLKKLNQREREVADCLASGWTQAEIGEELSLNPDIIDSLIGRIIDKLDVGNEKDIAAMALVQHIREKRNKPVPRAGAAPDAAL
jgi:DNA-binding CsgD family transcriptional regulator